ncbi:MAG: glucose-6-phosphate isomerase, partial [Clostridia bacterium]|nr:glucose-6-phosphate isomerase [Clostridia bacterium]
MAVSFTNKYASQIINDAEYVAIDPQVKAAHELLNSRKGPGNDFLGWMDLPVDYDKEEFARIKAAAEKIKNDSEVLLVVGIGGSYLGRDALVTYSVNSNCCV